MEFSRTTCPIKRLGSRNQPFSDASDGKSEQDHEHVKGDDDEGDQQPRAKKGDEYDERREAADHAAGGPHGDEAGEGDLPEQDLEGDVHCSGFFEREGVGRRGKTRSQIDSAPFSSKKGRLVFT